MARQTFSTHGFSYSFEDNTGEILKAFENARDRALEAIGQTAENYAQKSCPVDTGRLKNSIGHRVDKEDVYVGTESVPYSIFVEMGTHKKAARPFLRPAAQNHTAEYRGILQNSLENA